jgi:hypothetical protein
MNTCVARHPAVAALLPCLLLLIALISLLTLASCIGRKPSPSLLAADITKLGFIPGKPVSLPPDFKAECHRGFFGNTGYNFADGGYTLDQNKMLLTLEVASPHSQGAEPAADMQKAWTDLQKALKEASPLIGPAIPTEQRSKVSLITWKGKDIFSLTENELISTYGPPSKPSLGPIDMSALFGNDKTGSPRTMKTLEYLFQVGDGEYSKVTFYLEKRGEGKELVDMVIMSKFVSNEFQPLSQYKVYPWPGLYPAPGK